MNRARSIVRAPSPRAAWLTTALLSTVPVAAQCVPSRGPFAGAPITISLQDGSANGVRGVELRHKEPGFTTTMPARWSGPSTAPDFNLDTVMANCGAAGNLPDVNAFSIGEDWVVADAAGRVNVPANRWAGLTLSFTSNTRGRRGSVLEREVNAADGALGDLFSYVVRNSDLPNEMVEVLERANDSAELGLPRGADIDALDHFVSQFQQGPILRGLLLDPPTMFFTVSQATLNRVPQAPNNDWFGGTPPSAATIFQVRRASVTAGWTCPRVWKTFADLGLRQADDIDALAVDLRNQKILFSTTSPLRNPILVLDYSQESANPVPYSDQNGVPISDKIDMVEDDDVDAICAIDPSTRGNAAGINIAHYMMGTPRDKVFGFPNARVDASAFRFRSLNLRGDRIRTQCIGWPHNGNENGFAVLLASPLNTTVPLIDVAYLRRTARPGFCGDPLSVDVQLPAAFAAIQGFSLSFRWVVFDENLNGLTEAFPLRINL